MLGLIMLVQLKQVVKTVNAVLLQNHAQKGLARLDPFQQRNEIGVVLLELSHGGVSKPLQNLRRLLTASCPRQIDKRLQAFVVQEVMFEFDGLEVVLLEALEAADDQQVLFELFKTLEVPLRLAKLLQHALLRVPVGREQAHPLLLGFQNHF